jgi:hypothetical protein
VGVWRTLMKWSDQKGSCLHRPVYSLSRSFCNRFTHADLPGLIQKLIIPTDQRRSKPPQMTGLSLDFRLQHVSAAAEILPRPHGLAARLRNMH